MNKQELNNELLQACTAENIDLDHIENLLKSGANPLGYVEEQKEENLYGAVIYHFLDIVNYEDGDDSDFFKITELFVKYGMDISKPEIPYDDADSINPLWSFAFYDSEAALQSLKLLLDNGLDADSAGRCWAHDLTDLGMPDFEVDDEGIPETASECFRKVMLIASYPHIIDEDEYLQKEIWYSENDYDITKFRNWNNYEYLIEPTEGKMLSGSLVRVFEKDTKKEVWKFGFEITPEKYEWICAQNGGGK